MKYLEIPNTDIKLMPVSFSKLKDLRALLVKIYAAWLSNEFAVGDTVMDGKTWGLMKKAISMLPRENGGEWTDLEALGNDYEWIERTFFAENKAVKVEDVDGMKAWRFDLTEYQPAAIVAMHHFDHLRLLREANFLLTTDA